MFVLVVNSRGVEEAIRLAKKFHWRYKKPLRKLRAAMNEHRKAYSKRDVM
jgi:hypothetical protein